MKKEGEKSRRGELVDARCQKHQLMTKEKISSRKRRRKVTQEGRRQRKEKEREEKKSG